MRTHNFARENWQGFAFRKRLKSDQHQLNGDTNPIVWQWTVSKWPTKNTEENWRQPHRESRLEEGWGVCPFGVKNSLREVPVRPTRLNLQVSKYPEVITGSRHRRFPCTRPWTWPHPARTRPRAARGTSGSSSSRTTSPNVVIASK